MCTWFANLQTFTDWLFRSKDQSVKVWRFANQVHIYVENQYKGRFWTKFAILDYSAPPLAADATLVRWRKCQKCRQQSISSRILIKLSKQRWIFQARAFLRSDVSQSDAFDLMWPQFMLNYTRHQLLMTTTLTLCALSQLSKITLQHLVIWRFFYHHFFFFFSSNL